MSSSTPSITTLVDKSTSGDTDLIYDLNALESEANKYCSTNSLIDVLSLLPSTETIWCFNRVVISEDNSLLNFLSPSISYWIFSSSFSVKSLNSITVPELGRVKLNVPLGDIKEVLKTLFSIVLKSTLYSLPP